MPILHSTHLDYRDWIRSQPGSLDLALSHSPSLVNALDLHGRTARVLIDERLADAIDIARIRAMGETVSVRVASALQLQHWTAPCSALLDLSVDALQNAPLGLETSDQSSIKAARRRFEKTLGAGETRGVQSALTASDRTSWARAPEALLACDRGLVGRLPQREPSAI